MVEGSVTFVTFIILILFRRQFSRGDELLVVCGNNKSFLDGNLRVSMLYRAKFVS